MFDVEFRIAYPFTQIRVGEIGNGQNEILAGLGGSIG